MKKNRPLIIFGTSGAAKEIYYLIKQYNSVLPSIRYDILGFISEEKDAEGKVVCDNKKVIVSDVNIDKFLEKYEKIYAVIQFGDPKLKSKIVGKMKAYPNILYPNIIHPSVLYEKDIVSLGEGNIVAAGSIIASHAFIGDFNLINRSCTIGHDFILGHQNTINPGSIISGDVTVGNNCLLGAGSVILEKISICDNTIVGAGGVLTKNPNKAGVWVGIPAHIM